MDGKIRIAVLNAPGNFHDSNIADYGLYAGLQQVYDNDGGQIVVDSAYKVGNAPYLVKSSNINPDDDLAIATNCNATSIWQLSEWGMRIIQSSFPRLKKPLKYKEYGDRFIILRLKTNLYNYQTETLGCNNIFNLFITSNEGYFGYKNIDKFFNVGI